MGMARILNWLSFNTGQSSQALKLLPLALIFTSSVPSATVASPVILSCKDNDNLYDVPYTVSINAKLMTVTISRDNGINPTKSVPYKIIDIRNDNGVFIVTADGRLFNSHIVITYSDNATIAYSDAFSDRPIAMDNCHSVRSYKTQSR